jgi:CRP-like cAMP-binding protein
LTHGDLAGIEAVTADQYPHDAYAMTNISYCRIPVEVVREFSVKSPELHANLMRKWHQTVTLTETLLTKLSAGPSRNRVIHLILWLAENSREMQFLLPSGKEAGSILNLTPETVSRCIVELCREGAMKKIGKGYAIANGNALKKSLINRDQRLSPNDPSM